MTDTILLTCTIPGVPQQQGSKNRGGNGSMYEANKQLEPWRAGAIMRLRAARIRWDAPEAYNGGVSVAAQFVFPRPKSHYRTGQYAAELRADAPRYKTTAPDLDKLQRALGDALTQSGVLRDDALIAAWRPEKIYGPTPETRVTVRRLP